MEIKRLYPQYKMTNDRRQNQLPVDIDRRSGFDRRNNERLTLDNKLNQDIFEVKSKIQNQQISEQKAPNTPAFEQNMSKIIQNSEVGDKFVKSKTNENEKKVEFNNKIDPATLNAGGALALIFTGAILSTFLGPAAIGVGVGIGAYFGIKLLNEAIKSHLDKK